MADTLPPSTTGVEVTRCLSEAKAAPEGSVEGVVSWEGAAGWQWRVHGVVWEMPAPAVERVTESEGDHDDETMTEMKKRNMGRLGI